MSKKNVGANLRRKFGGSKKRGQNVIREVREETGGRGRVSQFDL